MAFSLTKKKKGKGEGRPGKREVSHRERGGLSSGKRRSLIHYKRMGKRRSLIHYKRMGLCLSSTIKEREKGGLSSHYCFC
jgi:hypothetical protein